MTASNSKDIAAKIVLNETRTRENVGNPIRIIVVVDILDIYYCVLYGSVQSRYCLGFD